MVAIASSGGGVGEGPYRSEIVVEVRCEISPSTGGIFTNRDLRGRRSHLLGKLESLGTL